MKTQITIHRLGRPPGINYPHRQVVNLSPTQFDWLVRAVASTGMHQVEIIRTLIEDYGPQMVARERARQQRRAAKK